MKLEDIFMFGSPRGPIPVERRLTNKRKGEAPKCKTCVYFGLCHRCKDPMRMICENYKRKKKKRK